MREKLVRNTSDKRWRTYWKAVDVAASKAPTLRYQDKKPQSDKPQQSSTKKSAKPATEG